VTRCDEIEPLLGELALGVLAEDRRSAVLDHIGDCLGCRALLLELAATADALLLACPPAEPSPGFDAAVMVGIGASRQRRSSRRSIVAALVAAVLLVAGGLAVGVRLDHREELRTAPLVAMAAGGVGEAVIYAGRPAWVFMRVDRALPDGTYRCVVTADGGPPVEVGSLVVVGGQGSWGRRIEVDPDDLRTARVESADGTVVASASFR
jgi:anti-sigma factor RsiW